jgi:hypothetical protein
MAMIIHISTLEQQQLAAPPASSRQIDRRTGGKDASPTRSYDCHRIRPVACGHASMCRAGKAAPEGHREDKSFHPPLHATRIVAGSYYIPRIRSRERYAGCSRWCTVSPLPCRALELAAPAPAPAPGSAGSEVPARDLCMGCVSRAKEGPPRTKVIALAATCSCLSL